LVRRVRHGLWALDPDVELIVVAPYLTAPHPAYVSFWSALARHGMIEQIPAQTFVASLERTKKVQTSLGPFSIHRLSPELFFGFYGSPERGYLATPEKALFDSVYIRAPRGGRAYFPELSLPASFDRSKLDEWVKKIPRPGMRTIVKRGLEAAVAQADWDEAA
jgi:predicted transcriptional regulator of viral defense system